jgi:hypothetical protein
MGANSQVRPARRRATSPARGRAQLRCTEINSPTDDDTTRHVTDTDQPGRPERPDPNHARHANGSDCWAQPPAPPATTPARRRGQDSTHATRGCDRQAGATATRRAALLLRRWLLLRT